MFHARIVVPCLVGFLAACGGNPASESGAPCEANPEPAAQTQHAQGIHLQGMNMQGISENGIWQNGVYQNGVYQNGVYQNGVYQNGTNLNGVSLNGASLNGENLNGVSVPGASFNELVAKMPDGTVRSGDAVVGAKISAVFSDGTTIDLTIASFSRDTVANIAYYRIEHEGQNVCAGDDTGMFVPGVWDSKGSRSDALTIGGQRISATFACSSGVLNKCVRWGYAPWNVGADLHQACTRMARADYCGNGVSFTKNGTVIDVFDVLGIQRATGEADLVFEAAWGPSGAVCVNRTRYDARTPEGEPVLPSCWDSLPKCGSFDDAKGRGATIGNASRVTSRTICAQ